MNFISKLLLLVGIFAPVSLQAQDLEPVLTQGKVWERYDFSIMSPNKTTIMKVDGDTVVNDKACKKVGLYESGDRVAVEVIHEDNGMIDWWSHDVWVKWDLYPVIDFNVSEGDVILRWSYMYGDESRYITVLNVFTIELFGHSRKCVALGTYRENGSSNIWGYWIEGIGCTNSECLIWDRGETHGYIYYPYLLSCYDGDELIYTKMEFENALNLAGISDITPDSPSASDDDGPIYNLQGQPVAHPRSGEIYIRSGRKFLCP